MRSVVRYQYVPLYAARLVTRADVDQRENVLTKKMLNIAMGASNTAVQNIYGTHYRSIGEEVAYAGT